MFKIFIFWFSLFLNIYLIILLFKIIINKRHNVIIIKILSLSTLVHIITIIKMILDNAQSNDPKIKIQKLKFYGLSTLVFIYKERGDRDRERNKKERREKRNKN
jgi:hypothetical protein